MKRKTLLLTLCLIFPFVFGLADTKVSGSTSYYDFEIECMGTDADGSQILKVWGKGKNKKDALEDAKKDAVRALIFKGINAGTGDCKKRPLITTVNAEEKYEEYFRKFFQDNGPYEKDVSSKDEKKNSKVVSKGKAQEVYGITVTVDYYKLKDRLINEGIIKSQY